MDIDSPPSLPDPQDPHASHSHLNLPTFSSSFPLPFRVLFLVGLAQLLWAINLHVLHLLGLDTAWILDFRDKPSGPDDIELLDGPDSARNRLSVPGDRPAGRPHSGNLYVPVYKLFMLYSAWVGAGWILFLAFTGGERDSMERSRWFVAFVALGAAVGAITPWKGVGERERVALRRALKRILLPSLDAPIFFSDVILADILTSFAKVLGDLWISTCQIWSGGITQGRVGQTGWANYITLAMVCLPYMVRFRQCIYEYHQSSYQNPRPLANSLKYFSAFPVILLSALQKTVVTDLALEKGVTVQEIAESGDRWFGEHRLFRLWLLAVVVNSMFSFWWDIEMDWGLALCEPDTWFGKGGSSDTSNGRRRSSATDLTLIGRIKRLVRRSSINHHRSPCPTPSPSFGDIPGASSPPPAANGFFAFGLRPILLLPDPLVYHLFAAIDLILRFTWSLKLSSHLHTISEIESGVFMMEALELMRRWMWVFCAGRVGGCEDERGQRVEDDERVRGYVAVASGGGKGWDLMSRAGVDVFHARIYTTIEVSGQTGANG
ncbi:protein-ER retention-related protein [Papiliotrema laurentii]|uniref:Protein-ER retention-related protein n=1 Tax=Papiliotrema laurentii TaxID=5418 RepID=A0AAD9FJH8_PAPLA|nr:protein-ER retention-related protein [Papiliotrema laurentii]